MIGEPTTQQVLGYEVLVHAELSLHVTHEGQLTWEDLMAIKDRVWGAASVAIEVFPPRSRVLNHGNIRHLWLLGRGEFYPDLIGDPEWSHTGPKRSLFDRYEEAYVV